ncbi:MAG: protein kinase [Kiritimatiellaeota bacterium]|nr:protein kinase [Kiritimatiellota bacterium]
MGDTKAIAQDDTPEEIGRRKSRILVVDDETIVLNFLRRALLRKGYEVDTATDAERAGRMLDTAEYDLVLSDVNLPGESGIELLTHCRQSHPTAEVILITGNPELEDAVRTVREGAYDYLAKPLELNKLYERVESALQRRENVTKRLLKTWSLDEETPSGFRVIRSLGSGTMGVVLLVRRGSELRAMKILRGKGGAPPTERLFLRFSREAEVLNKVRHPNIVRIYECSIDPNQQLPYILMEYVPGRSLAWHMAEGNLTLKERVRIIQQMADALAAVHAYGILHRDVKPSNILLTEDGQAKLGDFGIARFGESSLTMTGELLGTPAYMAPERLENREIDHRSDLFSLGVVAFELLSGIRPFRGDTLAEIIYDIVRRSPPRLRKLAPDLPPELDRIVHRMLEKKPGARCQDGNEIVKALAPLAKTLD